MAERLSFLPSSFPQRSLPENTLIAYEEEIEREERIVRKISDVTFFFMFLIPLGILSLLALTFIGAIIYGLISGLMS